MNELILRNIEPLGATTCDMRIRDGRIVETGAGLLAHATAQEFDGQGCLCLPGLVNAHTHIDKTLWGIPWHSHRAGPSVSERIENEREVLRTLDLSVQRQSERLARHLITLGTTHIRTHVDIDPELGLRHLHGVLRMRENYKDWLDIEIVAFPQRGLMSQPGTVDLLKQALNDGADVVGGIDPMGLDRDPKGHLDTIFELAASHDAGIDIHLHEAGEMGAVSVEMVAERTRAHAMQGKVVISHAFCLGDVSAARRDGLLDLLAELNIAVMTHGPGGGTPSPPVRLMDQRGVLVFSGSDGIRDAWGPLNTGDMLERAYLVSYINGFRDDAGLELSLHMATDAGASVMGLSDYGVNLGCKADLVLVPAQNAAEAVVTHPPRRLVLKNGHVVARDGQCLIA